MVILLEMTVGKVLWVLALFAATIFAYNLTCTDLYWESNAKRAALTLRNAGNHILVLSSMRLDCYGDDKRFEYTNKSVLLNPGQNMDLPSDTWMHNCSATFCSACLIYQCNIITQLNPNATLTFLYNVSGLVDFSGVGYAHWPHMRIKKYSNQFVSSTPVCPKDMVSVWTKQGSPIALIDIPNEKKKKTLYTVTLTCNGFYLLDEHGNATKSFTHTTPVIKSRADVIVTVPLQEPGETPRACTLNACLQTKRYCRQKVSCTFTIPDNSVALKNFNKWNKTRHSTVSCSQTKWVWSATDQQTGNLHIRLQNKDWKEKSFMVSVSCERLTALNDSLLVTLLPMVYTKLVTFPLKISAMKNSTTSTKCVIKLCNTAKPKCDRNTKCSIMLPMNNGKFITTLFNITNNNITGQCGSKAVTWSRKAKRQGTLSVKLQNAKQETINATASVNCSGLEAREQWNLTVELPPNTQEYIVKFKLKPTSIDSTAVETYCTVNICNATRCEYLGESCNTTIPVKDGFFAEIEDGDTLNMVEDRNDTGLFINETIWARQGTKQGTLSVELQNTKQNGITVEVTVNCSGLEIVNEEWNKTVEVSSNSQNVVRFRLRPSSTLDNTAVETNCTIVINHTENGDNKRVSHVTIPVKNGSFPDDNSTNSTDRFHVNSVAVWSQTAPKRGIVSVRLINSNNITVITEVTVNCAGLKVLKNQWNSTVEVLKNSRRIVAFEMRPISTIDLTAVETYCIVNICNRKDCENQRESHNVTIPIRKGIFSNGEDESCDPNSVTWEVRDPQRVIMSVELRNSKQENISVQVTVVCSEIKVQKNAWNVTAVVPGVNYDSLYSENFKLKPQSTIDITAVEAHCTIKTCNIEDCGNHDRLCSYDITIPIKNGLFPVNDEDKREATTLCPSDVLFSNQSSSDFPTVFVIAQNLKRNALPFIIEIICNNILVFRDNGTLSESVMKRIPSIQPKAQKVVEFRFQNNSNREKVCALDICVEQGNRCSSEMSCGFTFSTLTASDLGNVVSNMPSMTTVPTADTSTTIPVPTTDASTVILVPTEEQHEKLVNIQFDHDNMYCIPKLLFNKLLQTIQKYTGIHSKLLAGTLVFIVVIILLITILLIVIAIYCCCCQHHWDDAKKRSVGIVISSCNETNAMLNAMNLENSKFLAGKSDRQIPDTKFPITDDFDSPYDSFDLLSSDYENVGSPIYQLDSGKDNHVDQDNSAIYHNPEDHHHHRHNIDQHGACACDSTALHTAQLELEAATKQLDVIINDSEEQYSNLSVTRTDFSSLLHGWKDEDGDTGELLKSTNY